MPCGIISGISAALTFPSGMSPPMQSDFDPVTLRLFVAVCEEGNIARAAEREAIVASAVSKRIAAVEAQIGAPLLVRRRRGIEPTAAGLALPHHGDGKIHLLFGSLPVVLISWRGSQ